MNKILKQLNEPKLLNESINLADEISPLFCRMPHNHINVLYLLKNYMGDRCGTYLEIGVLWGASLGLLLQSEKESNFIGVDLFTNHYHENNDIETVRGYINSSNKHGHDFTLIKGDCCSNEVLQQVGKAAPNGIDLLFIDGDHTTQAVLRDFNAYKDYVNPGGFIVFDDYGFWYDVKRAIDLLKAGGIIGRFFEDIGQINLGGDQVSGVDAGVWPQPPLNASYIIRKPESK